jgi:DNA primase
VRIPEHIIEQIRDQADIVEVIGEHVRLKKNGRNYLGLCPFHNEKTPSFNVNPDRGIYKCFGCGKAGNVFTFVSEYQKLTFVDAVRALAQRLGIVIPDEERDDPTGMHARRDAARAALREAAMVYARNLETSEGKHARAYFDKRKHHRRWPCCSARRRTHVRPFPRASHVHAVRRRRPRCGL